MEKPLPPPDTNNPKTIIPPIGICPYRFISTKDNLAIRPVCTNPKLNTGGNGWGSNSCYDMRLNKYECPFVEDNLHP